MINTKYLLYISTCLLISGNVQASDFKLTYDSSDIFSHGLALHTQLHTPNELKPIPLSNPDNAVKLAAVCAVGGGGCNNLTFGSSGNSMDLDGATQCDDEGYVNSCPEGQVPDENNRCPHNKSYFKCRDANDACDDGYSTTTCSSEQVIENSYTNEAGSSCYQCRDKTCAEGGYTDSLTSCQKGTEISFANKTCYQDVTDKNCEDLGYLSSEPENNKCTPVTECGLSCYQNCYQPTCEEENLFSECPDNHTCTETTSYGKTCYKDDGQPSCSDGGYKDDIPTNNVCTQVDYYGTKCFKDCYQPTCDNGGYLDAQPAGQTCTPITYYGRNCFQNDCKNITSDLPILYSDKTVSNSIISGKTPIGIVFDADKKLAVALEKLSIELEWGGYGTDITSLENCAQGTQTSCGTDGKANTEAIIAFGKANNISYPAAEYCNKYTTEGTQAGEWFLPSAIELSKINEKKGLINATLNLLGKDSLNTGWHLSSTEDNMFYSWGWGMFADYDGPGAKNKAHKFFPVIQYGASSETTPDEGNSEDSKITCDEGNGNDGDIIYTDGSVCRNAVPGKTPYAIVVCTDCGELALVIYPFKSFAQNYKYSATSGYQCIQFEDVQDSNDCTYTELPEVISSVSQCNGDICTCGAYTSNNHILSNGLTNTSNVLKDAFQSYPGYVDWGPFSYVLQTTNEVHNKLFNKTYKGFKEIHNIKGLHFLPGVYEAASLMSNATLVNEILDSLSSVSDVQYEHVGNESMWVSPQSYAGNYCYVDWSNGGYLAAKDASINSEHTVYLFVNAQDFLSLFNE